MSPSGKLTCDKTCHSRSKKLFSESQDDLSKRVFKL